MIKSKNYNNVSEEMIPKLGRNEIAIFRSIHNSKDPSGIGIYPTYIVPNKDTIWDEVQGKYVDIAYIKQPTVDGKGEDFGRIIFETSQKGVITLRGSNPGDVLRYEFLKLSNYNVSNPKRNPEVFGIYEEVNADDKTFSVLDKAKKDAEIADFALNTNLDQLKAELKNRNIETKGLSEEKIRAIAIEEAKKLPFSKNSLPKKVDGTDSKALIMEAIEAGLISYDSKANAFKDTNGEVIFEVYKAVVNKEERFADYLDKNEEVKEKVKKMF